MSDDTPCRRLILCADDFGLSEGINGAILDLVRQERLTAVSIMAPGPALNLGAAFLRTLRQQVDMGVHLTLTGPGLKPLGPMPRLAPNGSFPSLEHLMRLAATGKLRPMADEIALEIARQYDRICQCLNGPPDFIDGHQHVHQLPVIRDHVVKLARMPRTTPLYVRHGAAPWREVFTMTPRAAVIALYGRRLARMLHRHDLPTNDALRAVGFVTPKTMPQRMIRALRTPLGQTILYVHPGRVDPALRGLSEPYLEGRETEYRFLSGNDFNRIINESKITLSRFCWKKKLC